MYSIFFYSAVSYYSTARLIQIAFNETFNLSGNPMEFTKMLLR